MKSNVLSALALGATLLAGTAPAAAQSFPHYGGTFASRHHIEGVVRSFGGFNMSVRIRDEVVPVNRIRARSSIRPA